MRFYVDVEKIENGFNLKKEEVESYSLKKVFDLMKKLEEKERKEKIDKDLKKYPIEIKKGYFTQYNLFCSLFGEKITNKLLEDIPFSSLSAEKWFLNDTQPYLKNYLKKSEGYHEFDIFHKKDASFTKKEMKFGYCYYVANQFQGLVHSEMIKKGLNMIFEEDFCKMFKIEVYEISPSNTDIYLKDKNQTLYISLQDLLNKNVENIKKSNKKRFDLKNDDFKNLMKEERVVKFFKYLEN